MFEGILERVLQRALGDYIEGLDRKNLKLGVWSGNINLENVHVKRSIFQKFKLPLVLRLGRIRKLQIIVPWRSLSSSPVEVVIQGVNLIICPKSKEDWELIETFHTNFELREQVIKDFAMQIYNSIIRTEEAEQQEQGFLKNLVTKILDNVQLTIQNIHVRLENYQHFGNTFSMGLTLKEIAIHTTNAQWEKEFFDRTKEVNQDRPVFKVLIIVKFGLYWRVKEDRFLARDFPADPLDQGRDLAQEDKMLGYMASLFGLQDEYIEQYKDSYLLQPIQLCMKLKQVTQAQQLEREPEFQISLDVDDFSIFLQKSQYDNMVHLMELFNDYSRYQALYQQTSKYKFLRPLKAIKDSPKEWLKFGISCIRREIRQNNSKQDQFMVPEFKKMKFQEHFQPLFKERMIWELQNIESGKSNKSTEDYFYIHIIQSINIEDLKKWATEIASQVGEEHKQDLLISQTQQQTAATSGGGVFSYITSFGTSWFTPTTTPQHQESKVDDQIDHEVSSSSSEEEERKSQSDDDEFFDAVDDHKHLQDKYENPKQLKKELQHFRQSLIQNFGNNLQNTLAKPQMAQQKSVVPMIQANFSLREFSVSLVDNTGNKDGIEIFSKEFTIEFSKYDETSEQNPQVFTIVARNEAFGINQLINLDTVTLKSPLLCKDPSLTNSEDQHQAVFKIQKSNLNCKDTKFDFDVSVVFRPIIVYYQLVPVNKLVQFLKVEDFKEEIKQQAYESFENFKQSVNLSEVIQVKQRNKLQIDIASPILIIPFKKNNDIMSECWVINMGNFSLVNFDGQYAPSDQKQTSLSQFNNFQISINDIMMCYSRTIKAWQDKNEPMSHVIDRFGYEFILSLPKSSEEKNIYLQGKMTDLNLYFSPNMYCNMMNIDKLLTIQHGEETEHLVLNEKSVILSMPDKIGMLKISHDNTVFKQHTAVIAGAYIYFYENQTDLQPSDYMYLKGIIPDIVDKEQTKSELLKYQFSLTTPLNQALVIETSNEKQRNDWIKFIQEKAQQLITGQSKIESPQYHSSEEKEESIKLRLNQQVGSQTEIVQQPNKKEITMNFSFLIPKITVKMTALKQDPSCSYDLGLFTDLREINTMKGTEQESTNPFKDLEFSKEETKWEAIIQLEHIYIEVKKTSTDMDVDLELRSLFIEDFNNPRFPYILTSKFEGQSKVQSLIKIKVLKKETISPYYCNIDMDVVLEFGQLQVNWHPKSMNRLIRFFRFMKFESTVIQQETDKFFLQNKKKLQQELSLDRMKSHSHVAPSERIDLKRSFEVENCETNLKKPMAVKVKLDMLQITLIHPINHTYPIATMKLGGFEMDYVQTFDHDQFSGAIQDLRMSDNTNYPLTIDPNKLYEMSNVYPNHELLGPRDDDQQEAVLVFYCILFHKPLDNECIHQKENYDKNIKLQLGSIKFRFINEWVLRINDYFFNQFLGALSDANPYQPIVDKVLKDLQTKLDGDVFFKVTTPNNFQSVAEEATFLIHNQKQDENPTAAYNTQNSQKVMRSAQTVNESDHHKKRTLAHYDHHKMNSLRPITDTKKNIELVDLNQQKSCAWIDMTMNKPLLIIKDRPYLPNQLEIELGQLSIQSKTEAISGRVKSHDLSKVWVTQFIIDMKQMSFLYNKSFYVANSFDINIVFEKPNFTPLIQDAYLSPLVDFTEVDMSYRIYINFSPLIMHFKQDAYQYLLRCNDLNFNYTDNLAKFFQLAIWNNGEDSLKYIKNEQEITRIHKNKEVFKMKVYLHFPSLALQIHHNLNEQFLTEIVLWNADVDFLKYIDYRKTITLKSHTFFILHNPTRGSYESNEKQVAIAPVNSNNFIITDKEFYNFEVQERVNKLSPNKQAKAMQKYSKKNFVINMHLEPDGEKLIQVKIEKLKIFIKPHIYLMIFELFIYGMPQYTQDSKDKPNYYDSDWGNAAKMEVGCQILQSLLCFENDPKHEKTIACQGNTSFTYIREKLNLIKKKLIEQPTFLMIGEESKQDRKSKDDLRRNSSTYQAPYPTIDSSSTFKIMQVSISDLCPFFCHPNDLDGKNFKQVRKREMMSPFTFFYNKQDIIELQKLNERLYSMSPDRLIFKKFNKVEANLERTLLKISFNDIKVLKGISDYMFFLLNQEYNRLISQQETKPPMKPHDNRTSSMFDKTTVGKRESNFLIDPNLQQQLKERKSVRLRIPIKSKTLVEKPEGDMSEHDVHESDEEEKSQNSIVTDSDIDEEEEDDYFDDEEQEKINLKLERNKEIIISQRRSPDGKSQYSKKLNNFTESVRRASNAFNMFQESYFQRNLKKIEAVVNKVDSDELAKEYEQIHEIHELIKLNSSPEVVKELKMLPAENNLAIREVDSEEDDLDEGDRAILSQSSLDILKNESPEATKHLVSQSTIQIPISSLGFLIHKIKEEQGVNQFQVVSYGLKILIINDSQQNFFPVLGISLSEFHFSSDQNETQKAGQTQFSSAINYYNAEAGEWEPFIESFRVHITIMEEYTTKKKILQCEIPTTLSMNITQKLVQNLSDTFKSWQESTDLEDSSMDNSLNVAGVNNNSLNTSSKQDSSQRDEESFIQADRGGTQRKKPAIELRSQKSRYAFEDFDEDEENESNEKEEEDVVTPYSICNQTNVKLLVKRLNNSSGGYDKRVGGSHEKKHKADNRGQHLTVKGGVGSSQSKLNRVYVINPEQVIDYAVDYELQVRQQMNMYNSHQFSGQQGEFIKILFNEVSGNERLSQYGQVNMSIPLNSVNLNQIGFKKHYIREDDQHNSQEENEFYVYGVQQVNMKKVLTIRTQYLFVNQTFFSYDIHVRFNTSSIVRTLGPGDRFPIPNYYNRSKFQIRISPLKQQSDSDQSSGQNSQLINTSNVKGGRISSLKSSTTSQRQRKVNESSLQELIKSGRDTPNFQVISRNWSDLLPISSLKYKLPINKATFLRHGRTFSIIKKEASNFPDAYDIVLRPPLLLKNCLPLSLLVEYEDSNGDFDRLDLQKQEEKHVFVFNLQKEVMMKVLIEGFQPAMIILDCNSDKDIEIKSTIYDFQGRPLDIFIQTSAKVAGRKAVFYVKNMIVNNTDQHLSLYYDTPSERQIKAKSSGDAVAGGEVTGCQKLKGQYYMLSDKQEIYVHLDGSLQLSNPINIFNPGCKDRFMLTKGQELFEYSYSTEIFLATKDDYVYTKITTISPQYVIVNQTKGELSIAQQDCETQCFTIESNGRKPFHWSDKDREKLLRLKFTSAEVSEELDWTCGIPVNEVGSITVRNRQKMPQGWHLDDLDRRRYYSKFLRIDRKFHKNTIFLIVEEENLEQPFYKIENMSTQFSLRYFQVNCLQHADLVNVSESAPFSWTNFMGEHNLQIQLFFGNLDDYETYLIPSVEGLVFPLDQLNYKQAFEIPIGGQVYSFYVWTFTDGFTKVIRFSDNEKNIGKITQQGQDLIREDENSQSLSMFEVYLKHYNLSVIGNGKELFTLYLQGIQSKLIDTDNDRKLEFKIGYLQLDNQSENDPIYPVIIKPKYIKPDPTINASLYSSSEADDETGNPDKFQGRTNPSQFNYKHGVFELYIDLKKNVPNVMYFELIEYLVQTFELKLEFSHILMVSKFLQTVGEMLNKNLTFMHQIFDNNSQPSSPERPEEDASPGHRLSNVYLQPEDDFTQGFTQSMKSPNKKLRPAQKTQVTISGGLMMEKKLFFGQQKPTPFPQEDQQQTIASSLNLVRNATKGKQDLREGGGAGQNDQEGDGSPKRQSSLTKIKTQQQQMIIDKMRQQDNMQAIQEVKIHKDNWKEEEFKQQASRIYIKEYRASPLEFEVSVMNKANFQFEEESDILKTISSLGLVISSIDEAPIKLNALVVENVFGNQADVIDQLKNHHTSKLKWNLLKLIGASNLLGNPMNFVNALGTGVQDFFYQPREGFTRGTLQGGLGIIKGTTSLVTNTFVGAIGSASKMAQSVSKGLLVLSNDTDYIYRRDVENIKNRPKNVLQGLRLGINQAFGSIGSGIVGVVSQPIEESKKGGILGFFKGTVKGVAGLVVKPISGTLDFFSQTTEGIKNTSKKDEELQQDKRLRLPRPFYEKELIIREYDEFHAFWVNSIPRVAPQLSAEFFFDACLIECTDTSWSVLILTLDHIALVHTELRQDNNNRPKQKKKPPVQIKWMITTKEIRYVEIIDDKLLAIGFDQGGQNLPLNDPFIAEKIRGKVEKIMKYHQK